MEQRRHARVTVRADTMIYRCGLPIATGMIRNACSGGLFIETPGCELAERQRVQCELPVADDGPAAMQRVWGAVVHVGDDGVGIRLDESGAAAVNQMIIFIRRNMETTERW